MRRSWSLPMLLCAVAPLAAVAGMPAAPAPLTCPPSLKIDSQVSPAPEGYVVFDTHNTHPLERIGFYAGPPAEGASLVPDASRDGKGTSVDSWAFAARPPEPVWFSCHYTGTSVAVAQAVEPGVTRCEVSYRVLRNGQRLGVDKAVCRR